MQTKSREGSSSNVALCAPDRHITTSEPENQSTVLVRSRRFCSRHRVIIAGLSALVLVFAIVGIFAMACWLRIQRISVNFPGSAPGSTTYLLVGNDTRSFVHSASDRSLFGTPAMLSGQHANVVVLIRVRSNRPPEVLSVPRDLLVRLAGGAPIRLTQSFASGAQTLVDTVCHSLGVGVSHLVVIQMNGLRGLVDDVGGITLTVPTPERDLVTGLLLPHAGHIRLNGSEALAYVRARHLQFLEGNDWVPAPTALDERSGRAREVLALIGERLAIGPTNPIGSARLIWKLSGVLMVDSEMSPFDMDQLAGALEQLHDVRSEQLPVQLHPGNVPTAELETGGTHVLAKFGSSPGGGCSANLPIAQANEGSSPSSSLAPSSSLVSGGTRS